PGEAGRRDPHRDRRRHRPVSSPPPAGMSGCGTPPWSGGVRPGLPRPVEVVVASAAVLALWPLLVVIAVLVRSTSPGPALFRQRRVGLGGRPFELLKFRTMTAGAAGARVTASGDRRVTAVGRWLRASKLDELPELVNIVRGEMSFVGPRPEVPAFVDFGDPRWATVLGARPGLTDPVTLRLRREEELLEALGNRTGEEIETAYRRWMQPWKLRGYAEYLSRRSAVDDVRVLLATLRAILEPAAAKPPSVDEILGLGAEVGTTEGAGDA
ncbi:MAG: sugar transferase, partial [Acidobacteriota bacterium]